MQVASVSQRIDAVSDVFFASYMIQSSSLINRQKCTKMIVVSGGSPLQSSFDEVCMFRHGWTPVQRVGAYLGAFVGRLTCKVIPSSVAHADARPIVVGEVLLKCAHTVQSHVGDFYQQVDCKYY
jgi:hypothetical protein